MKKTTVSIAGSARVVIAIILLFPMLLCAAEIRQRPIDLEYDSCVKGGRNVPFYSICENCPARAKLAEIPFYPPTPTVTLPARMIERVAAPTVQPPRPQAGNHREDVKQPHRKQETACRESSCGKHTVYFRFNQGELGDFEQSQLKQQLTCLKSSGKSYSINGYTCRIGSQKRNDVIADQRASSVATYLKENGVKVCNVRGQGKTNYISSANKINRRTEIIEKGEEEECR